MAVKIRKLAKVIHDEKRIINKRRKRLYPDNNDFSKSETNLVGLALSGGGIRSGVTNLGVLYEMSRVGLFSIVDYLSTVSGGGYIGCCVSSLLSLKQPDSGPISGSAVYTYKNDSDPSLFSANWSSFPFRDLPIDSLPGTCQPDETGYGDDSSYCSNFTSRDQVFHLRDRASYLIPSSLPFGSHVIRALGAVSATTLLSLAWFFSLLVVITTLYMLIAFPAWKLTNDKQEPGSFVPAVQKLLLKEKKSADNSRNTNSHTSILLPAQTDLADSKNEDDSAVNGIMKRASSAITDIKNKLSLQMAAFSKFGKSKWIVLLLGISWGLFAPLCMHWRGRTTFWGLRSLLRKRWWGRSIFWGLFAPLCMSCRGRSIDTEEKIIGEDKESFLGRKQLKCISLVTIAFLFVVLFISYFVIKEKFSFPDARLFFPVVFSIGCLAGSLIMLCLFAGNSLSFCCESTKDNAVHGNKKVFWSSLAWNRISRAELSLCSGIFIYCLAGSYIFAVLPAFILSGNAAFIALVQAGAILVLRYYLSGKKNNTADTKPGKLTAFLAKINRWMRGLMVPLFVLLAIIGIGAFLGGKFFGENWPHRIEPGNATCALSVLAIAGLIATWLSLRNFNNISPHVFYKDRLAEAFLATFMRCPLQTKNPENIQARMDLARNSVEMDLADLHGNQPHGGYGNVSAARGPYLLINATLNLTAARDLKGFRRQSENFLFSKCYTGSERTGYLATNAYKPPIELGRAMTISGAALTSVMGAQGSLAESFACTILGVRLGYWLRNPVDMAKTLSKRSWNWRNLYYELLRYTNSRDSHVYLSDGGHCGDNLGLLALLQRRTKLIIASDAECDPEHVFDSLNNSIRRAYVDYNIKIHISLDDLIPDKNKDFTEKHYAIGRILYPDRPWQKSWLLVIKNTMTDKESSPILNYKKKSPDFPHETTADQFFTEEQFEVYRSLGREACMEIWQDNINIFRSEEWLKYPWSCIDKFCQSLSEEHHKWDDVIRAIWHTEKGDFNTWSGFFKTITNILYSEHKDDSMMVEQLQVLHKWLKDNSKNFEEQLQGKFDVPRTWNQFEDIRYQFAKRQSVSIKL